MSRKIDPSTIRSIRDRLNNIARKKDEDFNLIVIRYALERLMYRLSKSDYASQFVLKGAALLLYWEGSLPRPTKDVDFTREQEIDVQDLEEIVKELCEIDIDEEDGMIYLPDTIKGKRIREGEQYEGIRVTLKGKLGNQQITVQLDVGFGDALVPEPEEIDYPVLLDHPSPELKAYQQETTIAEKFQNMVEMGVGNSRMKDFYDIWFLSNNFKFEGKNLQHAITETFKRRETAVPAEIPVTLSDEFVEDERSLARWTPFLNDLDVTEDELSLNDVVEQITSFVMPACRAINKGNEFDKDWVPGKGW